MILHLCSLAIAIGTLSVKVSAVSAPGEIVCRYEATTKSEVNYYTCHELAAKYSIAVEKLFQLNPAVDTDCDNIQPNTVYCVAGCKYFEQIYIDHANRWQSFNQWFLMTDSVGRNTTTLPAPVQKSSVAMERRGNVATKCTRHPLNVACAKLTHSTVRTARLARVSQGGATASHQNTAWTANAAS
jgi:hypothetical protein